jgi:ABC-type multidrug transport system fused ATPase/permease subunit
MVLIDIIKEYIAENKFDFYCYVSLCCITYFIKVIVTSIIYGQFFETNDSKEDFLRVIRNICITWILLTVLYVVQIRLEYKVIPTFLAYIRKRIFKNYIVMNETDFKDNNVTDDVNNILEMTRNLRDIVSWGCQTLIPTIFVMVVVNIYFLFKYPFVGFINVIGNLINAYISLTSYENLVEVANERMERYIIMANKLDESFNNLFNAYINDKIDDTVNENSKIEAEYYESFLEQMRDLEIFSTKLRINNYIFALGSLYTLYSNYSKADFISSLLIYTFYLSSLNQTADDIPFIIITIGNINRSEKILLSRKSNVPKLSVRPTYSNSLENFKGDIKFENIWFKYDKNAKNHDMDTGEESPYVFKNLNLEIGSKSKIAIVARSGSGKSTLMKLLLGFYVPEQGRVLLDGEDIKNIDPIPVRKKINYINQRTLLIKDTVMNNIKYGNNKTDQEVIDILNKYNLLKIFNPDQNKPESCLQNIVEKNGINISMGMQKVIFLVRGILRDGEVYIFDEPLTSIDSKTRASVLQMIGDKTQDKTLIIITHDMEVSKIVDKVINIDDINQRDKTGTE